VKNCLIPASMLRPVAVVRAVIDTETSTVFEENIYKE